MKPYRLETIHLSDGYPCQAAVYAPIGQALSVGRRPVLVLHGVQSHGGWFGNCASVLSQIGHTVLVPDRRGSGANGRDRGHARSIRQLLDDGRTYLERAADLAGGPVHLLGISWGGKWAVALAAEFPDLVASLLLSTPGLYSRRTLGGLTRLAVAVCAVCWPRRRFTIPLSEPDLFTAVEHWQQFIATDPLRLRQASARFMAVSHLMERRLPAWAAAIRCPTLLVLADRDPIVDNDRVLALLTERIAPGRLTVRRFQAAVHTLEFVADPADYFRTLMEWVDEQD